ncbi:putative terpene synthase 2 [Vitis vinifera]|uniref:Putative terpene synthase 2 n=1 Tax=Vitis vinifera TaxID=29760 RepID=A0A438G7M3_VITVI|nr:putative terpene synthase 2 [Vitis vinifera]
MLENGCLEIIADCWDKTLKHPLYATAFFLNPRFQYKRGVGIDPDLLQVVHEVFAKLDPTVEAYAISRCKKRGFGDRAAIALRSEMVLVKNDKVARKDYLNLLDISTEITLAHKEQQLEDLKEEVRRELIAAIKSLVQAYLVEAKWLHGKYIPTIEEYMGIAMVTVGVPVLTIMSFIGMIETATKEVFDWLLQIPKIVRATYIIIRLMDDMASHKFEQEREHTASSIECYMKQHGVSEQQAYDNSPVANPETNRRTANYQPSIWGNTFIVSHTPEDESSSWKSKEEVRRELMAAANIFNRYTDEKGRFKESLINDACGLLGLYEAAHLRVWEEDILDEALAFTTTHLKSMVVERPRFSLQSYLFRDRVVEGTLDSNSCFEPSIHMLEEYKPNYCSVTTMDDIFDAYGTLEELSSLQRQLEVGYDSTHQLPEYMKPCYQAVLDAYKEIEEMENTEDHTVHKQEMQ